MQPDYTGIAARLRGSISDGWSGDAFAADANNAEEAANALIEARDTIAALLEALIDARDQLGGYEMAANGEYYNDIRINAAITKATGAQ